MPLTDSPSNVGSLINWLCDNLMKDPRKDMFVLDDSVQVPSPSLLYRSGLRHLALLTDWRAQTAGDLGLDQRCGLGVGGRGEV